MLCLWEVSLSEGGEELCMHCGPGCMSARAIACISWNAKWAGPGVDCIPKSTIICRASCSAINVLEAYGLYIVCG